LIKPAAIKKMEREIGYGITSSETRRDLKTSAGAI
jgi:hypothetical protein